jgi:hypothetical protein
MAYGSGGAFDPGGNPIGPTGYNPVPTYGGPLAIAGGLLGGYTQGLSTAYQRALAMATMQRNNLLAQARIENYNDLAQTRAGNLADTDARTGSTVGLNAAKVGQIQYKDASSAIDGRNALLHNGANNDVLNTYDAGVGTSLPPGEAALYFKAIQPSGPGAAPPMGANPPGVLPTPAPTAQDSSAAAPVAPSGPLAPPQGTPSVWLPPANTAPLTLGDGTVVNPTPPGASGQSAPVRTLANPMPGAMPAVVPAARATQAAANNAPNFTPQGPNAFLPATPSGPLAGIGTQAGGTPATPGLPTNANPPGIPAQTGPTFSQSGGAFAGTAAQIAAEADRQRRLAQGDTSLGIRGKLADNTIQHTANADELAWRKTVAADITASANDPTGIQAQKVLSAMSEGKQYGYDTSFLPPVPGTPDGQGGYNPKVALNPQQVGQMAQGNLANTNAIWRPIVAQADIKHQQNQDSQGAQRIADAESNSAFNQYIAGQHLDLDTARVNLEKARQSAATNPVATAAHLESNLAAYSKDLYTVQNGPNKLDPQKYVDPTTGLTSPTDPGNGRYQLNPKWSSAETGRAQFIASLRQHIADTQALRDSITTPPAPGVAVPPGGTAPAPFPNFQTPAPGQGPVLRGTGVPGSILRPPGSKVLPPALQKVKPQNQQFAGF